MRRRAVSDDDRSTMQRLLATLAAIGESDTGTSLATIAAATGLPKSTVHRMVNQLLDEELIVRTTRGYQLGTLLLELGRNVPLERDLRIRALPFMLDLYAATKQCVMLAVFHCDKVLYIETLAGHNARIPPLSGYRQAPHTTALGKVLVAQAEHRIERLLATPLRPRTPHSIVVPNVLEGELERFHDEGVAYDREETLVGLNCVAAPIHGAAGENVASIAIATPRESDLTHLAVAARTAAAGIGRAIQEATPIPHERELGLSPDIAAQLSLRSKPRARLAAN